MPGRGQPCPTRQRPLSWRLPGFPTGPMHVSRRAGRSSVATVHRTHLPEPHVRRVEGIPVTSPARTIFDLAGILHPARTERALDNALARRLTTMADVHRVAGLLAVRAGSALMRRLLADRDASYVPPESNLESRFEWVLRAAGVRVPRRQRDVGGGEWVARADYLDPDRKVVVEIDSDLHHSTLLDEQSDSRRDEALGAAGYRVVRVREHDLWHRPEEVLRRFLAS